LKKLPKLEQIIVTAKNRKEVFLERSPKSNEDYFLVPRVVE
jgi:Asp-tRNA(Asn)/Glu-tRNA(Gln) amidotransferase C subunit